jgi:tRNA-splicing ligase RtcB
MMFNSPKIKAWASDLEGNTIDQINKTAELQVIDGIAIMPDAHIGKGSTVGSVIATSGAIIPAAVGVDIGCGMACLKLPFKIDSFGNLKDLRHSIERSIPLGKNHNKRVTPTAKVLMETLGARSLFGAKQKDQKESALALGTLGGGNHFIEICGDQNDDAWIMLHSGSRNIGKRIADFHINRAKGLFRESLDKLPDPDLAYLVQGTKEFEDYIHDLLWAQSFARLNREELLLRVLKDVSFSLFKDDRLLKMQKKLARIDCHHNYSAQEEYGGKSLWITRKGAVSAKKGELGIVPGSMGASSFITVGKGLVDSYCSSAHGAGRWLSRTAAREKFKLEDLINQTKGIECRKDQRVIDEIPSAYKNIDQVMKDQADLVTPLFTLKQILNVKG